MPLLIWSPGRAAWLIRFQLISFAQSQKTPRIAKCQECSLLYHLGPYAVLVCLVGLPLLCWEGQDYLSTRRLGLGSLDQGIDQLHDTTRLKGQLSTSFMVILVACQSSPMHLSGGLGRSDTLLRQMLLGAFTRCGLVCCNGISLANRIGVRKTRIRN